MCKKNSKHSNENGVLCAVSIVLDFFFATKTYCFIVYILCDGYFEMLKCKSSNENAYRKSRLLKYRIAWKTTSHNFCFVVFMISSKYTERLYPMNLLVQTNIYEHAHIQTRTIAQYNIHSLTTSNSIWIVLVGVCFNIHESVSYWCSSMKSRF